METVPFDEWWREFVDAHRKPSFDVWDSAVAELVTWVRRRFPEVQAAFRSELVGVAARREPGGRSGSRRSSSSRPATTGGRSGLGPSSAFRVRHRDALVWIPALAVLGLALVGVRTILAWLVSPGALW